VVEADGKKTTNFTIQRMELLADAFVLKGTSQQIAWRLIWYGEWGEWPVEIKDERGQLVHIDFPFGPPVPEDHAGPIGSHPVGALSDMISRCYLQGASATVHTTSESEILRPGYM